MPAKSFCLPHQEPTGTLNSHSICLQLGTLLCGKRMSPGSFSTVERGRISSRYPIVVIKTARLLTSDMQLEHLRHEGRVLQHLQSGPESIAPGSAYVVLLLEQREGRHWHQLALSECGPSLKDVAEAQRALHTAGKEYKAREAGWRRYQLWLCEALQQLAEGLQYIHSRDVAHGDLSRSNVGHNGCSTAIYDFGSAVGPGMEPPEYACTPSFRAPENREDCRPSMAADIWAVGVLTLELLTGETAWGTIHEYSIMDELGQPGAKPPYADEVPHDCRHSLPLLDRAFSYEPEQRGSAAGLVQLIKEWQHKVQHKV